MKRWKWIVAGVLTFGVVAAGISMMRDHNVRTNPMTAKRAGYPIPVQVVAAAERTVTETIGATGEVKPIDVVSLRVSSQTRVQMVAVDIGEVVEHGQVLLVFDRELLQAELSTAQAAVSKALRDLDLAGRRFDRELLEAELTAAQSAADKAAGDLDRAIQYLQRIRTIHEQGLLAKLDVEKAQEGVDKARAQYDQAQKQLLVARKNLREGEARARADLEAVELQYSQAQEKLLRSKENLKNATLTSPVAGIVMERFVHPGEVPKPIDTLFTIGRIDQVLVEVKVPEERIGDVHVAEAATVTSPAFPYEEWEGRVVKIKPVADPATKTFLVYVTVGNGDLKLKPGLTGVVRIKKERSTLVIPSIALITPTGTAGSSVFVVDGNGVARLRKVKVGASGEGMTEARDGLRAGDHVVTVGQLFLQDGVEVRIGDELRERQEFQATVAKEEGKPQ